MGFRQLRTLPGPAADKVARRSSQLPGGMTPRSERCTRRYRWVLTPAQDVSDNVLSAPMFRGHSTTQTGTGARTHPRGAHRERLDGPYRSGGARGGDPAPSPVTADPSASPVTADPSASPVTADPFAFHRPRHPSGGPPQQRSERVRHHRDRRGLGQRLARRVAVCQRRRRQRWRQLRCWHGPGRRLAIRRRRQQRWRQHGYRCSLGRRLAWRLAIRRR
jgi:hypothetical protein